MQSCPKTMKHELNYTCAEPHELYMFNYASGPFRFGAPAADEGQGLVLVPVVEAQDVSPRVVFTCTRQRKNHIESGIVSEFME